MDHRQTADAAAEKSIDAETIPAVSGGALAHLRFGSIYVFISAYCTLAPC